VCLEYRKHFPMLQDVIVPYHKAQANPAPNQGVSAHGFRDSALDTAKYRKDCAAKVNHSPV
jgi:hypothetical protein